MTKFPSSSITHNFSYMQPRFECILSPYRIRSLLRSLPQLSLQKPSLFSSVPAANSKLANSSTVEADEAQKKETGSAVYQRVLKTQRPSSIALQWNGRLRNSVSLIGSVDRHLEICKKNTKYSTLRAYTLLNVKNLRDSNRMFRIKVEVRNRMAKMCIEHLKPNDLIYVSGRLKASYWDCKILVNELYYVAQPNQSQTCQNLEEAQLTAYKNPEETQLEACQKYKLSEAKGANLDETGMEVNESRLYLWQVFFRSPHEWWDNRKNKKTPGWPDFKHKDTGEALWLSPKDPPWVKRQLQLFDLKMIDQGRGEVVHFRSRCSWVSPWTYV